MIAKIPDQNDLIEMLTWQFDMGIDEALLDYPVVPSQQARMGESSALAGGLAGPNAVVVPQEESKPLTSENKTKENDLKNRLADTSSKNNGPEYELCTPTSPSSITSLANLQAGLARLEECPLKHTASNLCFADGNAGSRLMIIGEVPGRDEDRVGLPFVGDAGQLLDKMLKSFNLDRTSTYLTNLLPWRPPGNRTPTSEELIMLKPWLLRHIQLAKPEIVLLLGGAPAKFFLGSHDGIMKLRGAWCDMDFGDGIIRPTLASLHPSYLLRSPAQKRFAFEDLLLIVDRLNMEVKNNKSS
ncbi:uracil-DNA glycosylase [Candidatus Puniceispirillum sp.]|nr:uracil-DNA glycosylase [Candidatus Puniceispirillum sp.]